MKKNNNLLCFVVNMQTALGQDIDSLVSRFSATKDNSLRYEIILSVFLRYSESDWFLF